MPASERARVVSGLPEQTCHVSCVELVELVESVLEPKRVKVDQHERVSQREQSRHVEVVLSCVAFGEPVDLDCGLIPQRDNISGRVLALEKGK